MATAYDFKPAFQSALQPLMRTLAASGVSPNAVTVAGTVVSVGAGACLAWRPDARWPLVVIAIALAVRMALNALDGMLARTYNLASPLGVVLNELGDVVSDVALYVPFALVPGISGRIVAAMVLLAMMSEMAGVVSIEAGAGRRYDGPMGKSDRAVVMGAIALALALGAPAAPVANPALGLMTALLVVTIVNRAAGATRVAS